MTHEIEPESVSRTSFDEWEANLKAEQTLRQIKEIRQGLFKREEKINLLEGILYIRLQEGEPVEDFIQALALLQENKVQDEELELKRQNSLDYQMSSFIVRTFLVGVMLTVTSYAMNGFCGNSQSKICLGSRVMPNYISDMFREPAKPSRVLPASIKALE